MNILLQRTVFTENSTIGQLFVNDIFECHTLEDRDRFIEDGSDKVNGDTAIPRGQYIVLITNSNRFKRPLPLLCDVKQFTGVRIHAGNDDGDTEGCILVGVYTEGVDDWISFSRSTLAVLQNKIQEALNDGEEVILEVS